MCAVLETQTFEPGEFSPVHDMEEIHWFRLTPEQVPEIDLERIRRYAMALEKEEKDDGNWKMMDL